jgi:uncharacterized RDD family membrane protein YckC
MNNYATFWQRFMAMLIDFFVLLPLVVVQELLGSISKGAALALVIPMAVAYEAYWIYCHGRFGQTVGKRVMGIRVVRTTGERIGWREAWLRSSVEVLFSVLGVIGSFVALATIAESDYYGVGWMQRAEHLAAHEPAWLAWTMTVGQIWIWSEVIVMLFNKSRRALHDFIAGTVVTSEQRIPDAQTHAAS